MKRIALLFMFVLGAACLLQAQVPWSFKGTVTKMRMADCTMQRGFKVAMSGSPAQSPGNCPEYTIMSEKVVYVVVARQTEAFLPLAENIEFLIRKNELATLSSEDKVKSRFVIAQMILRADWEREEARKELETEIMERSASYETRNPPRTSLLSSNAR